jgi:hypothetical protein
MAEQVSNRTLYHVTVTKPHKRGFVSGQSVRIGEAHNPFFQFYESPHEYPVTDGDTGQLIQVKAVSWLRRVRDGLIRTTPDTLSQIALEVAQHYVMLCRELIMEHLRQDEFNSGPPSRQRCLYACATLEEAKYWAGRLSDPGMSICSLEATGTIHRADARLLIGDSEPLSKTVERGRTYWRGELSSNPELETLFVGDAVVTAVDL